MTESPRRPSANSRLSSLQGSRQRVKALRKDLQRPVCRKLLALAGRVHASGTGRSPTAFTARASRASGIALFDDSRHLPGSRDSRRPSTDGETKAWKCQRTGSGSHIAQEVSQLRTSEPAEPTPPLLPPVTRLCSLQPGPSFQDGTC